MDKELEEFIIFLHKCNCIKYTLKNLAECTYIKILMLRVEEWIYNDAVFILMTKTIGKELSGHKNKIPDCYFSILTHAREIYSDRVIHYHKIKDDGKELMEIVSCLIDVINGELIWDFTLKSMKKMDIDFEEKGNDKESVLAASLKDDRVNRVFSLYLKDEVNRVKSGNYL